MQEFVAKAALVGMMATVTYKIAVLARRTAIAADSRNTTMTCPLCGALNGSSDIGGFRVRMWEFGACGASYDQDLNAAVNILASGLAYSLKVPSAGQVTGIS